MGANSPRACPTLSGVTRSDRARRPVRTRMRRPTLDVTSRTARGLTTLSLELMLGLRLASSRRRIGGIKGGFHLERDIFNKQFTSTNRQQKPVLTAR